MARVSDEEAVDLQSRNQAAAEMEKEGERRGGKV
jgi:hypothetical protein